MAVLIYQAGFKGGTLKPSCGADLGPLQLMKPDNLPGTAETEPVLPSGLRFRLTRTEASPDTPGNDPCVKKDDCYFGAVIYPFPTDVAAFKVRATFEMPRWETGFEVPQPDAKPPPDYGWAMVVFARIGDVSYQPIRWERTTVTLQSSRSGDKLQARMNTPCGAPSDTPNYSFDRPYPANSGSGKPISDSRRQYIFESNDAEKSRVTIELLIDRKGEIARAGLEAPAISYVERRWFVNPNITGDMKGPIDSVGFAIANASGLADLEKQLPASSVIIRDFSVYQLNPIEVLVARLSALICRIIGCGGIDVSPEPPRG